jgi:muramoyltetrapeptide carboxypeptidase
MGFKSIHGIMPISSKSTEMSKETLRIALFGEPLRYDIAPHPMNRFGTRSGELVGGNLSILYSVLGSKSAINCDNKILFIEDLDEYLYHIDRMLMNLKRCGCLEQLNGIVVGSMTKMKDNEIPWGKNALEIIDDIAKIYKIPIVYNFPAGHIADNRALILGNSISLEVNEKGSVVVFD